MKYLFHIIFFLSVSFQVRAQYLSPFNQKVITTDSSGNYSFIISGHFYGDGGNKSHFPANTLLANLEWVNEESNADMLVCLGDLFKDISNDIPNYETSLFNQLEIPLVNSVGNHDLTGTVYQDNYGKTAFLFEVNNDLHLVLDTEQDNGDIEGEQLALLERVRDQVNQGDIHNVFIYTHRTVWSNSYEEMDGLFQDNTQSLSGTNFSTDVIPLLNEIGQKVPVFWFSGSLGTAPASFFYFHDAPNNLTIIATAIRSLPRDAVLIAQVNQGEVSFLTHSFTGQDLLEIEAYDVNFWQTEVGAEPFNWKLIPYYMELAVTHRYFWYGILTFSIFFFSVKWGYKRFVQNKTASN